MSRGFDWKFGFQDPVTPIMEGIIDLHNHIFFFLIFIFVLVAYFFYSILKFFFYYLHYPNSASKIKKLRALMLRENRLAHGTVLEIIWTVTPSLILVSIAIPSFALLYSMDEVLKPMLTFKAIGHQWYWAYEFTDLRVRKYNKIWSADYNFDANMLYEDQLSRGEHRLLQTDNPVVLPTDVHIRVIITSTDVLHSWAVPALGVKVDAVPGRLNQTFVYLKRPGMFYGQCSELCGVSHAFMPVQINAVPMGEFREHIIEKALPEAFYYTEFITKPLIAPTCWKYYFYRGQDYWFYYTNMFVRWGINQVPDLPHMPPMPPMPPVRPLPPTK